MKFFIVIIFSLCIVLELLNPGLKKCSRHCLYGLIITFLIIAAGFRDGFLYRDYENYINYYYYGNSSTVEYSFFIIASIAKFIQANNYIILFIIYAILGVGIKAIGLHKLSPFIFASLAIYISYYYSLHELTQIRAGVATAIGLLSISSIYEKKPLKFLFIVFCAIFFHASAVIYLPLYFIKGESFNKKNWTIILFASFALFYFMPQIIPYILSNIMGLYRADKLVAYINRADIDGYGLIGGRFILSYTLCAIFIAFSDRIHLHNKYFFVLLKIFIISIVFRIIFSQTIPVLGTRGSDLFEIVSIAMIPMLIYVIKPRIIAVMIVAGIGVAYLINVFIWGLLP